MQEDKSQCVSNIYDQHKLHWAMSTALRLVIDFRRLSYDVFDEV